MSGKELDESAWWGRVIQLAVPLAVLFSPLFATAVYVQQAHGYVSLIGLAFILGYFSFRVIRRKKPQWFSEYSQIEPDNCLLSAMQPITVLSSLSLSLAVGPTIWDSVGIVGAQVLLFLCVSGVFEVIHKIRDRMCWLHNRGSILRNGGGIGALLGIIVCNLVLIPILRITGQIPPGLLGSWALFT